MVGSMSRKANCWDTQFTMVPNAAFGLTRAGIGDMPLGINRQLNPPIDVSEITWPPQAFHPTFAGRCSPVSPVRAEA
jgi:hypothetical protein